MNHGYYNPGSSDQTLTMKSPLDSSVLPLMDIDPFAQFEFHFPADEPWWDEFDIDTSDYFSCDSLSMCSSDSDFEDHEDLNLSFPSMFYHICDTTPVHPETIPTKEDEICRRSPQEEDILIPNLVSTISNVAPKNIYQKRKNSMRRKRQRRRRKKMAAANVEPELRTLYLNLVGVLPATDPVLSPPPTPTTLPTINLSAVNKQMLRRLPDVVYLPVLSCSPDPAFYERNLPCRVLDNHYVSAFGRDSPFGKLPAIHTDLGPIPPPTDPCFGYVWTEEGWRVKAERPPVPDPGGGRGRVGGQKEEDERGGQGWRRKEMLRREK